MLLVAVKSQRFIRKYAASKFHVRMQALTEMGHPPADPGLGVTRLGSGDKGRLSIDVYPGHKPRREPGSGHAGNVNLLAGRFRTHLNIIHR